MFSRLPFFIAALGIVGGVFIAIIFGINEDFFKDGIKEGLQQNTKIQSMVDDAERSSKLKAEEGKNWRYFQRFHFHATGIGAMSLGLLLLLGFLSAPNFHRKIAAYLISVGGFLYPFVWLFAAIYGPEMGRHEAKEAFQFFAWGGGLFLIGATMTMAMVLKFPFTKQFNWPD